MKRILFLLPLLLAVQSMAGQAPDTTMQQIDALMNAYANADLFDGVVLVADRDDIIYHRAFGLADREWQIPMTLDTKFRIGSISKSFTALLILQLVQEGRLRLDGTLADYLPDYQGQAKDRITVHQLLTHTSGILNGLRAEEEAIQERLPHHLRDLIKYAEKADLNAEPGSAFHYSNLGYNILACIAEQVTEKPFALLLQEKIFTPAGMSDTRQYADPQIEERLAQGYEYKLLFGFEKATYFDNSYVTGCGSLISTAKDLHTWVRALRMGHLLAPTLRDQMYQSTRVNTYGYGWDIRKRTFNHEQDTLTIADHAGSINGFGSYLAQVLEDGRVVIVLKNHRNDTYISPAYAPVIGQEILSILYGETVQPAKKSIARQIALLIGPNGIEQAKTEYYRIKKEDFSDHSFDESELNKLGIELLFKFNRPQDALKIFEINMQEFPRSFNTYDSYAYVLMQLKEYESAIRFYKEGLKILQKYPHENSSDQVRQDAQNALKYIAEMEAKISHK